MTGKIGGVDFLAFDGDVDAERLVLSGYESQFIPAFTVPKADGRASTQHIEGSTKGEVVVDLVPRLQEILKAPPN